MRPAARDGLTAAQVASLIRDSSAIEVTSGLEIVDLSLNLVQDITDDFLGGSITRANYATLHGTADLNVTRDLDWGTALIRPYMTITDQVLTARFNMGVYLTSSPRTEAGEDPVTHAVAAYDILHWLNTPVGEAFVVAAGTGYLAAIETILIAQGILAYQIDQTQVAQVLPTAKAWAMDDHTTWLNICNDLCAAVGYQGIWSDWDGRLRIQQYLLPSDRSVEWVYDIEASTSMLAPNRAVIRDWFDVPNRWVYFWSKDPEGAAPVEGAGLYVFNNTLEGPTSQAARGRVISAKPEQIDAVDQTALVAAAQQKIDADLRLKTTFEVITSPNPLHWHFDKVTMMDPALGPISDALSVRWTLPLNGDDMTHELSLIVSQ